MAVTLELPPELEKGLRDETPDLEREAMISFALDLFRREKITLHEFGTMLGMTRMAADAFLARRGEYAQTATMEDMESDYQYLIGQFSERGR